MSGISPTPATALKPDAADESFQARPVGIGTASNRVFTRVNRYLCEMLGYDANELVGKSVRQVFSDDGEFDRVGQSAYADLSAHGACAIETRFRRKDGHVIPVLLTSTRTGPPTEATFVVMDVSDARQSEQELQWQNRELTAFHRISDVMMSGQSDQIIFDAIARETAAMTDFPMVSIEVCDFDRSVMAFRGTYGLPLEEMPVPFEVPMDLTISGEVAHTGRVLVETQTANRREYSAPIFRKLGVATFVCIPIKANGGVVGTLSLAHTLTIKVDPGIITAATSLSNYLGTLFDRLHARETARQSEAELAAVYDRAPSAMCLFDEHLEVVRANRAAAEYAGCSPEELNSSFRARFFPCGDCVEGGNRFNGSVACHSCDLRRALTETLITGKSSHQERLEKVVERNGVCESGMLLLSTERIQVDGRNRVLMCLEDITKDVQADEQIRSQAALLDITGDAIFVRNFSNRIIYWNEGAHRLYGWNREEAQGRTVIELKLSDDQKQSIKALEMVQKQDVWTGEMHQKTRQGRDLIVQSRWTLMRERDGKPKAILVVNTDITEKKQLESQLLRSQRLESIGTLASGLAHDLNNVLAPIMMAVQFLKENAEDDSARTCLQTLETCSQRGANIIRQVLMFARGVEGERILINPKHLILEMQRIARETFPRSIEIHTNIPKDPCVLCGDATQIQQVLMNLCVNARDAMPRGGMLNLHLKKAVLDEASAGVHPKARPGAYVLISVEDTGIGIAPELMDKIFDPFFTTKPVGQGTGLGLPTVLGIVESHGGFLHVESSQGNGTKFQVYIPAAESDDEDSAIANGPAALNRGNGELILIADDEPAVRRLASAILNRNGYRTVLAAEGREALTIFEEHHEDIKLVISDLMMPQLDGPGLLRALRAKRPDVRAILITGLGEENRIAEARSAGADAILSKPFTADQLLLNIAQIIN